MKTKVVKPVYKARDNILFIGVTSDRLRMSFNDPEQKRQRQTFVETISQVDALIVDGTKESSLLSPYNNFFKYGCSTYRKKDALFHFEDGLNHYDFIEDHGMRTSEFILFKYWRLIQDLPDAVFRLILDPVCLDYFYKLYGTPQNMTHDKIAAFIMQSVANLNLSPTADLESAIYHFSAFYKSILFQDVYAPKIQEYSQTKPKLGVLTYASGIEKLEEVLDGATLVPKYWYEYVGQLPADVQSAIYAIQSVTKGILH